MRHLTALVIALSLNLPLFAQLGASATIQNMHLWRGGEVADGFVLTTDLSITSKDEHFTLGVWGGMNAVGEYKEFNYYAVYRTGGFSLTLADTYNFSTYATYNNEEFFNYRPSQTGRFLDAAIRYQFGDKFPLELTYATVVFGRDRDEANEKNIYSAYCAAEYTLYNREGWQVDLGAGAAFALHNPGSSANFYGEKGGVVEATLRVSYLLELRSYSIPTSFLAMWNPQSNQAYLQLSVQLLTF
ncbi:MAG: hypothetical protein SNJ33_07370 [Rikenellaceae bacterium]